VFLGYIIVVCIVGLASSGSLASSFKSIHCAIIKAVHSLTYGDTPRGWVGIEPLKDKLVLFDARLSAFFKTTADVFPSEPVWV